MFYGLYPCHKKYRLIFLLNITLDGVGYCKQTFIGGGFIKDTLAHRNFHTKIYSPSIFYTWSRLPFLANGGSPRRGDDY